MRRFLYQCSAASGHHGMWLSATCMLIDALSAWLRAVRTNVIFSGVVECNLDGSLLFCMRHLMVDGSPLHKTALFRPDLLIAWVRHYAHKYADQTWAAALLRKARAGGPGGSMRRRQGEAKYAFLHACMLLQRADAS